MNLGDRTFGGVAVKGIEGKKASNVLIFMVKL